MLAESPKAKKKKYINTNFLRRLRYGVVPIKTVVKILIYSYLFMDIPLKIELNCNLIVTNMNQ